LSPNASPVCGKRASVCLHRCCQNSLLPKANKSRSNKEEGQNKAEKELTVADHDLILVVSAFCVSVASITPFRRLCQVRRHFLRFGWIAVWVEARYPLRRLLAYTLRASLGSVSNYRCSQVRESLATRDAAYADTSPLPHRSVTARASTISRLIPLSFRCQLAQTFASSTSIARPTSVVEYDRAPRGAMSAVTQPASIVAETARSTA